MNYEQLYKNALEKARKLYEKGTITESLNYIFPELKESEDEMIRKEIISALKFANHEGVYDKHITWLEKLKVFAEHGDGLYYFGNNGFTYVDSPTWDNVSWLEKR